MREWDIGGHELAEQKVVISWKVYLLESIFINFETF